MPVHLRRPAVGNLRALLDEAAAAPLTYAPVGLTGRPTAPAGYRLDRWSRRLGSGEGLFERADEALRRWRVHEGAGLVVAADGPATAGAVVAMAAPLPVGWVDVTCRVVAVAEGPDRAGFTYGTLPVHPEQGEESFTLVRAPDGTVTFEIVAVARLRHPLARACPPVARALQRAGTTRYLDAMAAAVGDAGPLNRRARRSGR